MSFLPHTLTAQAEAMRLDWPGFRFRCDERRQRAVWRGSLKPRTRTYGIEMTYESDQVFEGPHVRIVSPRLTRLPGNKEGSLPHVYILGGEPVLCLFDPKYVQWTGWDLIAKTTVPWTIDWLSCYEFWLMTGEWEGGGRHPPRNGRRRHAEVAG